MTLGTLELGSLDLLLIYDLCSNVLSLALSTRYSVSFSFVVLKEEDV